MKKFRIILGAEVKDKLTGLQGIVTARAEYATGCDQYLVQPIKKPEKNEPITKIEESIWFDDGRLEIVKDGNHMSVEYLQSDEPGYDSKQAPKK